MISSTKEASLRGAYVSVVREKAVVIVVGDEGLDLSLEVARQP